MLYANTDEGSSAIWVCDGNGVVLETVGYPLNSRAPILAQINEHYGTSFTGWSDNEIYLRIGDTFPNWDAYEKIILQTRKIAANYAGPVPNEAYMIGTLTGSIFKVFTNGEGGCICKSDGLVLAYNGPMANNAEYIMQILNNRGLDVDSVENEIVDYEINSYIPNWNEYEKF